MFDLGWSELFLIALVVLIVIGPKELPKAMRTVAKWVRKGRRLAREFQSSLDELAKESELDKVKDDLQEFTRYDPAKELQDAADPDHEIERSFRTNPDMPTINDRDDPDDPDDLLELEQAGDAPVQSVSTTEKPAEPRESTPAESPAAARETMPNAAPAPDKKVAETPVADANGADPTAAPPQESTEPARAAQRG